MRAVSYMVSVLDTSSRSLSSLQFVTPLYLMCSAEWINHGSVVKVVVVDRLLLVGSQLLEPLTPAFPTPGRYVSLLRQ